MPLAICLLMHIDLEVLFIFYGYGGCGLYVYTSYIIYCILFVCFCGLSSKKHRCSWHVLWQNSEPVCRLVDKHVENVSPEDMDGLLCGNVPCDCFFVSKLPAYSYKRIFKKSAKKTSKSLCSKSSLYCHDFKTKFRISKQVQQKDYDFMASSHFLGLFFETKKLIKTSFNRDCLLFFVAETAHSFHMPKVINLGHSPPLVGRPRIRRFLLSLG